MIANIIAITRTVGRIGIIPIVFIWNLIETVWEARDTNWEDD